MKPSLRTRRARGPPSRPEQGSTPAHPFYRFGKHYRAGLQAPERVSIVRMQGSKVSGESVEQSLGGPPKCVPKNACLEMKGIPWRQRARDDPGWHGSRLTSNMKRGVVSQRPTERSRGSPPTRRRALRHWRRRHLPQYDGLVRGLRVTNCLAQGLPPLSGAALVLQLVEFRR